MGTAYVAIVTLVLGVTWAQVTTETTTPGLDSDEITGYDVTTDWGSWTDNVTDKSDSFTTVNAPYTYDADDVISAEETDYNATLVGSAEELEAQILTELERAYLPSGGRLVLHNGLRLLQGEANRKCREEYGGSLAIVRSEEDFRLVEEYLIPQITPRLTMVHRELNIWINGTTFTTVESEVNITEPIGQLRPGQLGFNDTNTTEPLVENCMMMTDREYFFDSERDHLSIYSKSCEEFKAGILCEIPPAAASCLAPLGISDGRIEHPAFSASSMSGLDHQPSNGRLFGPWAWAPAELYHRQWMKVDLGLVVKVTGIVTQGTHHLHGAFVTSYHVAHSFDDVMWEPYQENGELIKFEGNNDPWMTKTTILSNPILLRYVAILPMNVVRRIALRMEALGCVQADEPEITQTYVSGTIDDKQEWNVSGSPYIVSGAVNIVSGGHVTIMPGVKVAFTNLTSRIDIRGGCIDVLGEDEDRVEFFPAHIDAIFSLPNQWSGVYVHYSECSHMTLSGLNTKGASTAFVVRDLTELYINDVSITYSTVGIDVICPNPNGSVIIDNVNISDSISIGARIESHCDVSISRSRFINNLDAVHILRDVRYTKGIINQVTLTDVAVTSSSGIGARINPRDTIVTVQDCVFERNSKQPLFIDAYHTAQTRGEVIVDNCRFHDNKDYFNAIDISQNSDLPFVVKVTNTAMTAGKYGIGVMCYSEFSLLLRNVTMKYLDTRGLHMSLRRECEPDITVINSTFHSGQRPIELDGSTASDIRNPFSVNINTSEFINNTDRRPRDQSAIVTIVRREAAGVVNINDNNFINNTAAYTILLRIDVTDADSVMVTANTFENKVDYELYVDAPWKKGAAIIAKDNWWGTTILSGVVNKLYGFTRDVQRAEIRYSPVRAGHDPSQLLFMDTPDWTGSDDENMAEVGGPLSKDLSIPAGARLTIISSINVPPGVTLEIGKGAHLNFTLQTGILVQGKLKVGEDVIFRPDDENQWGGILMHGAEDVTIKGITVIGARSCLYLSETNAVIESTLLEQCGQGLYYSPKPGGSLTVSDTTITQTITDEGLTIWGSVDDPADFTVDLHNIRIYDNVRNQLTVEAGLWSISMTLTGSNITQTNSFQNDVVSISFAYGDVTIKDNVITSTHSNHNEDTIGAVLSHSNLTLTISNNKLSHWGHGDVIDVTPFHLKATPDIVIKDNDVRHYSGNGYKQALYFNVENAYHPVKANVSGNKFVCDSSMSRQQCVSFRYYQGELYFAGNTIENSREALYLEAREESNITVDNNIIRNNSGDYPVKIYYSGDPYLLFLNNTISDNKATTAVFSRGAVNYSRNFFDNPLSNSDVRVDVNVARGDYDGHVTAVNNWWGNGRYSHVITRIYDRQRDTNLAEVIYEPFLTSRNRSATSSYARSAFFFSETEVGGIVKNDVILKGKNEPYLVLRDIFVPLGRTLTLKAGTKLQFAGGIMTVEGRFITEGDSGNPVVLEPREGSSWNGLVFVEPYASTIRLIDGNSSSDGVIEVFLTEEDTAVSSTTSKVNQGEWHPLCMTKKFSWRRTEAEVVCRQLGYNGALEWDAVGPWSKMYQKPKAGRHGGDVVCRGQEAALQACRLLSVRGCGYQATVSCNTTGRINFNDEYASSRSSLSWTHITGGKIKIEGRPPVLTGVTVTGARGPAVHHRGFLGEDLTISKCNISYNLQNGVSLEAGDFTGPSPGNVVISDSTINHNEYGIHHVGRIKLSVSNTEIGHNSGSGIYSTQYISSRLVIDKCNISGNTRGWEIYSARNVTITNNKLMGYKAAGSNHRIDATRYANIVVRNNDFTKHVVTASYQSTVLYIMNVDNTTSVKVEKNRFLDNIVTMVINVASVVGTKPKFCPMCNITGNVLKNNTQSSDQWPLEAIVFGVGNATVSHNVFHPVKVTNGSRKGAWCDVATPVIGPGIKLTDTVKATHNYWGVDDLSSIYQRTCSFYTDLRRTLIEVIPYYSDPDLRLLRTRSSESTSSLGGEVLTDLKIATRSQPYHVSRSFYVGPEATLSIEGGATLKFARGSGIYSTGKVCFLSRAGGSPVTMTANDPSQPWNGINIVREIPETETEDCPCCDITNVIFEHTYHDALKTTARKLTLTDVTISNVMAGDGLAMTSESTELLVTGSTFQNISGKYAINMMKAQNITIKDTKFESVRLQAIYAPSSTSAHMNITLEKCSFIQTGGLNHKVFKTFSVKKCLFSSSSASDIDASIQSSYANPGSKFILQDTRFERTRGAESVRVTYQTSTTSAVITGNTWENVRSAIKIYGRRDQINSTLMMADNTIKYLVMSPIGLVYMDDVMATLQNNTVTDVMYPGGCAGIRITMGDYDKPETEVNPKIKTVIKRNQFRNNTGASIIQVISSRSGVGPSFNTLRANTFKDNEASEGVIMSESSRMVIESNIFNNVKSRYDVRVKFSSRQGTLQCPANWWGATEHDHIRSRVFDGYDDPWFGIADWGDPLLRPEVTCEGVSDCSGKGECVRPNVCECMKGWTGNECNEITCEAVGHCNGHGECTAPAMCRCRAGWLPPDCATPTCFARKQCSGKGKCVAPDVCYCYPGYAGEKCDRCADGHWGPNCEPCPECMRGYCTGEADTEVMWRWVGALKPEFVYNLLDNHPEILTKYYNRRNRRGG